MPRALRITLFVIAAAVAVYLLFEFVFPWVEVRMENPTLEP